MQKYIDTLIGYTRAHAVNALSAKSEKCLCKSIEHRSIQGMRNYALNQIEPLIRKRGGRE